MDGHFARTGTRYGHETRGTRVRDCLGPLLPLCIGLLLVAHVGTAQAYVFTLSPQHPPGPVAVGDTIAFDVHIDTEGESAISAFSVGIAFDDERLAYRRELSEVSPAALWSQGAGKAGGRALTPFRSPPRDTPDFVGLDHGQVRVEFLTSPDTPTEATAANEWLATLVFEAIAPGEANVDIGLVGMFDSLFTVIEDGRQVDISEQVGATGSTRVRIVPEPGTALLCLCGLALLGTRRRRDAFTRGAVHGGG